ncbi:TPA: SufD family Fe-S cluster assembly protein, partial [Candidatus Micrarchaeota archaeon]|nr:SufD family Fe-S cluster assembly protein [Candidatus Micrarchaeota archaeon]
TQPVHNVIVADEGAVLDVVTGCTVLTDTALHIGVSEFYVGRDATVRFLMVHNWERGVDARPRTGVLVEEGGKFISCYANFFPARRVQSRTSVYVKDHGYAYVSSVLMARRDTRFDVGAGAHLQGEGASVELVSRAVLAEGGSVDSPLEIRAEHPGVSGRIDCKALQLGRSRVSTVPRLVSEYPDVDLSHEAYVGRLDRRKVEYLMSKGLTEEEATALIVRGFVRLDIPHISEKMRAQFESIARLIAERATG